MALDAISIETEPAREDIDFLSDRLNDFNVAATGIPFDDYVSAFVRDDKGEIVAGIFGWTWGGCCEIRFLWVHEGRRGKRVGTRLLQAAESEAIKRGCNQIVLDTHSFQAPGFYAKLGYEVVGVIDGYPGNHQKIYLRKQLRPA